MKTYIITEKAGHRVAGFRNTGVGTYLTMPEEQAAGALAAEELVLKPGQDEKDEATAKPGRKRAAKAAAAEGA